MFLWCVDTQLVVHNRSRESSLYDNILAHLSMTMWEIDIDIKGINKSEESTWEYMYNKDNCKEIISGIDHNSSKMIDFTTNEISGLY